MAVRLEWAHAQLLGQGEGLAVVAGGGLALGGRLARHTLTQEPQGPGLVAALLVLAGEVDSLRGALARLFQAASQQIRLAEAGDHERQTPAVCPWRPACSTPCSTSARPAATRPSRAYATPRAAASLGKKSGMCQSWHRPMARSSTGMARCTSPWRRYTTLSP